MKNSFLLILISLITLSACKSSIEKATISFYAEDKILKSVLITDKSELKIIGEFLSGKVKFADKLPVKYFLKVNYQDGKSEEYNCNSYFLKNEAMYYNPDTILQKRFLMIINSKLPSYLQQ